MPILADAAKAILQSISKLNTKNANEVLYTQKLINALYKSPIVVKQKGKTFKLIEDGKWGPKTEAAVKFTFGKIPSLKEMIAVQQQYSDVAAKAVAAQATGGTSLSSLAQAAGNVLDPAKAVARAEASAGTGTFSDLGKAAADVAAGTSPWLAHFERLMLEQSNRIAEQILQSKMQQGSYDQSAAQQAGYNAGAVPIQHSNTGKYIFMGAAALAIILIIK